MEKFNKFYIKNYNINLKDKKVIFNFSFDNKLNFKEELSFDIWKEIKNNNKNTINTLLINLSIAIWISYFKLYPFAKLTLPIKLDENQINFWNKFYINWLWEFLFKNNIDPKNINIINWEKKVNFIKEKIINNNKALLLWWWGKDSIVWYNIIKDNFDYDLFVVGKIDKIKQDTANIVWKQPILIKRNLDKQLFELNNTYYNWHVPITWIISFISLFIAYLYWYNYIFTSNEKSASEENTIWKWYKINHQYSKSIEFENDFKKYNNFLDWIKYKSLLSDFTELEIVEKFTKLKEFFPHFSSCNKNFKINWEKQQKRWCCNCEKCAFVYLILSAFLDKNEVIKIFWEDLFENKNLLKTYKWLIWKEIKPFECVWTHKESITAFKKIIKNNKDTNLPFILEIIKNSLTN